MKTVVWLVIMVPLSALFTGIGIYAWRRKKPMWFWAGTEVKEETISDVRAFNRANGIMWIAFSGVMWLSCLVGTVNMAAGGIALAAGTFLAIPLLILTWLKIERKYTVKKSPIIRGNGRTCMRYYLAVDIGASSGRHIVGWKENGEIRTREVYRFPNGVTEQNGHLTWDIAALENHVKQGIDEALKQFPRIESLSIDTWGVDYVLMDGDWPVLPCYAYRDDRTQQAAEAVHGIIPFSELYRRTGIQFQPFNTVYQLYADKLAGRLEHATGFLMIPEYLMYRLCGTESHEYTNATTGGLVSAETGEFDPEIIRALELPEPFFRPLQQPGTVIGEYRGIRVTLCATHDTASAVEGIPMEGNAPYISSGTWSLLGVKVPKPLTDDNSRAANYSNEGGVGYTRYQKNIMGMWLVNRLRAELCPDTPWDQITLEAEQKHFDHLVDVNDPIFLAPESMKAAFDERLPHPPKCTAGYFRCAYRSLAQGYKQALQEIERNAGIACDRLYIVGGGAKNQFLNRLTEEACGKRVIALPIEATAIGNLKVQMEGASE